MTNSNDRAAVPYILTAASNQDIEAILKYFRKDCESAVRLPGEHEDTLCVNVDVIDFTHCWVVYIPSTSSTGMVLIASRETFSEAIEAAVRKLKDGGKLSATFPKTSVTGRERWLQS